MIAEAEIGKKKVNITHDFGITPSLLSTVLKNKDFIQKAHLLRSAQHKKVTLPKHEELDKAVYTWFVDMQAQAKNIPLSEAIGQQKALIMLACLALTISKPARGG